MNCSIGEVAALAVKAVRGAGQPWGVAEEAGWAVRWLARAGQPGAAALARALSSGNLGSLLAGLEIADTSHVPGGLGEMDEPLLALAFIARLAPSDAAFEVEIGGATGLVWRSGCVVSEVPGAGGIRILGRAPLPDPVPPRQHRIELAPEVRQILDAFAGRTFAPATEESRLKGAGAGLIDND